MGVHDVRGALLIDSSGKIRYHQILSLGKFDPAATRQALEIAEGLEPVAMLCVGYPDELPEPTPRRHIDEIVDRRP